MARILIEIESNYGREDSNALRGALEGILAALGQPKATSKPTEARNPEPTDLGPFLEDIKRIAEVTEETSDPEEGLVDVTDLPEVTDEAEAEPPGDDLEGWVPTLPPNWKPHARRTKDELALAARLEDIGYTKEGVMEWQLRGVPLVLPASTTEAAWEGAEANTVSNPPAETPAEPAWNPEMTAVVNPAPVPAAAAPTPAPQPAPVAEPAPTPVATDPSEDWQPAW